MQDRSKENTNPNAEHARTSTAISSVAVQRKTVVFFVGIEFLAFAAVIAGATPMLLWAAAVAASISAIAGFALAVKIFRPAVGVALSILNVLGCIRLWSVAFLLSGSGVSKYGLIVLVMVRVFGWIVLAIINQKAKVVCQSSVSEGKQNK